MMKADPPEISVVIPCLNEALNVGLISAAVIAELDKVGATYEIVFIDNGSTDGTSDLIRALCAENHCIRLIINTRNFGQMRSPTHAIYQTRGRAIIGICADFQDPPEMIGNFIARWRAGAPIVLAVRQSEAMSLTLRAVRLIGYRLFELFGDYPIIPGATGFGLYDRRVVDILSKWRDPEPFFRGMLLESGFDVQTIPYHRPPRVRGQASNNVLSLIRFGISALAGSAKGLLRAPLYASSALFALALATLVALLVEVVAGRAFVATLIVFVIEIGFGLNFLFLGILGEQVRLVAEMARKVPLVVEKERVNFEDDGAPDIRRP